MTGFPIEIDATQLFARGFGIPGVTTDLVDSRNVQTFELEPGSYRFQIQSGEIADFVLVVTDQGSVDYEPTFDRFLSGRGSSRLTISGFEVTLDARELTGSDSGGGVLLALSLTNDDWISLKTCRLLPQAGYIVQQGSGQVCKFTFGITRDGTFFYDATHDASQGGALSGQGTSTLTFHGFGVTVDATAIGKDLLNVISIWGSKETRDTGRLRVVVLPADGFRLQLIPGEVTQLGFNVGVHGEVTPLPSAKEGRIVVDVQGGEPLVRAVPRTLIGSVRVTPTNARPGESVLIEALAVDGGPADPSLPIMINGLRGSRRYMQHVGPGTFTVTALAKSGDVVESASAEIVVAALPWPDITGTQGPDPIQISDAIQRWPLLSAAPVLEARAPYHLQIAASDTAEFLANMARSFQQDQAAAQRLHEALAAKAYHWDFGDGSSVSTTSGLADHDFSSALSVDEEHRVFDVTCAIETAGAGRFEVKRTLSIVNAYAVCRNRGVLAPTVVQESYARKVFSAFEASIAVQNHEAVPLTLASQRICYEKGNNEVMGAIQALATQFILAPNAVTTLNLSVPFTQVPADATGIRVLLLGKDNDGRTIHVEAHLDVALPDHRSSGLLRRGMAFTRVAAVGFDKVMTAAELTQLTPQEAHPEGPGPQLAEPVRLQQHGVNAAALHRFQPVIGNLQFTPPVRATFAQASSTSFAARDFSAAFAQLADNEGVRNVLSGGPQPAPHLLDGLHLDPAAGVRLRDLSDIAREMRQLIPGPVEGETCDPDNLPDTDDDAWTCQVNQVNGADEMITWHRHACFANARKGDLLLAPGGPSGVIGGLLRQVHPAQHYGHIGIMTRNYDMVTHSTFSEEHLKAHPNGKISLPFGLADEPAPTEGHDPLVLRYGWPGVVTQWVKGAVGPAGDSQKPGGRFADLAHMPEPGEPEKEVDPVVPLSTGEVYWDIAPFNRYAEASYNGGDWDVVPPLVVKPDPLEETAEVRARLHAIADAALAATGKGHYRFFCYTDASIGLTMVAPADAGWAQGTFPSVCSSFIWALLTRAGIHMESLNPTAVTTDLEALDVAAGAEVGEGAPDGLYLYRADERQTAAQWLHDKLKDDVAQTLKERVTAATKKAGIDLTDELAGIAGGLIDLFSDIGDDVANQMVNAFASDDASTAAKDSDAWKQLSDSRAVSPDNTMFWDAPSRNGLYGYVVPASFVPERIEQAPHYVWKRVPTHGALHGILKVAEEPKSRGMVQLTDSLTAFTDANGHYNLPKVPFGGYTAKAQWDQGDGVLVTGSQRFEMKDEQQELNFDLQRPAEMYRTLHVKGDTYFMKYYAVGENPRQSFSYEFSVDVAPEPGRNVGRWTVHQDFHGIYGVAAFLFLLEADGVVHWDVAWAVSEDAGVVEDMADALSSAAQTVSLGFISHLFGNEVNGADSRSGDIGRNAPPAADRIQIGPGDGTTGQVSFTIENFGI